MLQTIDRIHLRPALDIALGIVLGRPLFIRSPPLRRSRFHTFRPSLFPSTQARATGGAHRTPSPRICPQNQAPIQPAFSTMSGLHPPSHASAPFAPRAFVLVNVGRTAVNLYPVIDISMPPHEQAHAFHINVTALILRVLTSALNSMQSAISWT